MSARNEAMNRRSFTKKATATTAVAMLALTVSAPANAGLGDFFKEVVRRPVAVIKEPIKKTYDTVREPVEQVLEKTTGRRAEELIDSKKEKLERAVEKFRDDPIGYVVDLPGSVLADVCGAPALAYERTLRNQAGGRWKRLPQHLIDALRPKYDVNLDNVRYAERIKTANGDAQTYGNLIYFPTAVDLTDRSQLHWMLHELEHTVQYAHGGQKAEKVCEYQAKAIGKGFNHDAIDWERAADRKADFLLDFAYNVMIGGQDAARATRVANPGVLQRTVEPSPQPMLGTRCKTRRGIKRGYSMPIGSECFFDTRHGRRILGHIVR